MDKTEVNNKILVLEDNADVAFAITKFLSRMGYDVDYFDNPATMFKSDKFDSYDCFLIDINLPEKNGFEVIEKIRIANSNSPAIAITARDMIDDKLTAFSLGFTDYIVKPFDLQELEARIRAHLRTISNSNSSEIVFNKFKINPEEHTAFYEDKKLKLTKIEFRILLMLIQKANLVVEAEDLIEFAWGDDTDMINPPIRMHVSHLRKKIGDDDYTVIETIPGIGYKLNG